MNNSITFQKDIKRFYVSGKISGIKIEYAKQNFHFACLEVQKYHGADFVVNPLELKHPLKFWIGYMIICIWHQRKCTHSAFRKDWIDSKGAVIEYFFAKFIFKHGIVFL